MPAHALIRESTKNDKAGSTLSGASIAAVGCGLCSGTSARFHAKVDAGVSTRHDLTISAFGAHATDRAPSVGNA